MLDYPTKKKNTVPEELTYFLAERNLLSDDEIQKYPASFVAEVFDWSCDSFQDEQRVAYIFARLSGVFSLSVAGQR